MTFKIADFYYYDNSNIRVTKLAMEEYLSNKYLVENMMFNFTVCVYGPRASSFNDAYNQYLDYKKQSMKEVSKIKVNKLVNSIFGGNI